MTTIPPAREVDSIRDQITAALAARTAPRLELVFPGPTDVAAEVCAYCGALQPEDEAEHRTREHIVFDLLAVHRTAEALAREFRISSPGYEADVYDLLCELDGADRAVFAAAIADASIHS